MQLTYYLCGNLWQLGEDSSVPLKCAVVTYTDMPEKIWVLDC